MTINFIPNMHQLIEWIGTWKTNVINISSIASHTYPWITWCPNSTCLKIKKMVKGKCKSLADFESKMAKRRWKWRDMLATWNGKSGSKMRFFADGHTSLEWRYKLLSEKNEYMRCILRLGGAEARNLEKWGIRDFSGNGEIGAGLRGKG